MESGWLDTSGMSDAVLIELLKVAISKNDTEIIDQVLISHVLSDGGSEVLQFGAQYGPDMLEFLLSYDSLNPMFDLRELAILCSRQLRENRDLARRVGESRALSIISSTSAEEDNASRALSEEETMYTLARHRRVVLELANITTIRILIWGLRHHIQDSISGYIVASATIGEIGTMQDIATHLEGNHVLFRTLMLKRLSGVELIRWMTQKRDRRFVMASRCILEGRTSSNAGIETIRGLLLCLLYPTMDMQEGLLALKDEGMDEPTLAMTARLIGSYLGESGMRS